MYSALATSTSTFQKLEFVCRLFLDSWKNILIVVHTQYGKELVGGGGLTSDSGSP